jgi:hypothetical protein
MPLHESGDALLLMILLKAVHPPAVGTALAFAMHLDPTGSFVLFALAVGSTALLVVLQRATHDTGHSDLKGA